MMKITSILCSLFSGNVVADHLQVGSLAPHFSAKTHEGGTFNLFERKGKWTVLYFYPKDDTPGCTKQACAFRDSIELIRKQDAEVYGISRDDTKSHQKFVEKYHLNFPLLADPQGTITKAFGAEGLMGFPKRWTFIIDPELTIRWIQKNVDPAQNASEVAREVERLKKSK